MHPCPPVRRRRRDDRHTHTLTLSRCVMGSFWGTRYVSPYILQFHSIRGHWAARINLSALVTEEEEEVEGPFPPSRSSLTTAPRCWVVLGGAGAGAGGGAGGGALCW
jgi:hypothetical protein